MRLNFTKYMSLGLLVVFISSCASIEITKRRYRPGYHIDMVKKNDRNVKVDEMTMVMENPEKAIQTEVRVESSTIIDRNLEPTKGKRVANKVAKRKRIEHKRAEEFTASLEAEPKILEVRPYEDIDKKTRFNPYTFNKNRVRSKFERALRPEDGDKSNWSIVAFIAMGLGTIAFAFLIMAISAIAAWAASVGPFSSVLIFGAIAAIIGIGAMISGIIGLKDTKDKKGRGFALAGMISGIVGLVFGLIFLIWGAIVEFVLNSDNG